MGGSVVDRYSSYRDLVISKKEASMGASWEPDLGKSGGWVKNSSPCPACGQELVPDTVECFSCGALVARSRELQAWKKTMEQVGGMDHLSQKDFKKLEQMWSALILSYEDKSVHQNFLNICDQLTVLPLATHHYSKLLKMDPEDEIALFMRDQSMSRLTVHLERVRKENSFFRLSRWLRWTYFFGLSLSLSCVFAGWVTPGAENLVGLGGSLFLVFLILWMRQGRG